MDQHLQVFSAVVEKQNFSKAAEALHMTQPAVSQYIRILEEQLGVRLLERTNKYVRLNKAGEIVYHHAREITGLYNRMQHLVDDLTNDVKGPLAIGASYTFGEYVLPPIIARMKKQYPEIHPTIQIGNTSEIAHAVIEHRLDIGIVEGHFKKEDTLQTKPLFTDKMEIVLSPLHPLTKKNNINAVDLNNATWILRELGSGTREAADQLFQKCGIAPSEVICFSSTQSIKGAVEAGLGITLLSKWAVQRELKNGNLQTIQVDELPFTRQFSIVMASSFQTKALEHFIHLLQHTKHSL